MILFRLMIPLTYPVHSTGFVIALSIGIICRSELSPLGSVLLSLERKAESFLISNSP